MGTRRGEVSERLKEPASKAGSLGNRARRFKSYPLRQISLIPYLQLVKSLTNERVFHATVFCLGGVRSPIQ